MRLTRLPRGDSCYYTNKSHGGIYPPSSTKALSQTSGAVKNFFPKNLEGASGSTKYTDVKYEYVGNLAKIKLLETRIMAYNMRDPFIISTLVDEYSGAVEYSWGNHVMTWFYLLSHWLKVYLHVVAQFQRYSYENYNDGEYIDSCYWTKEIFVKSSDNALI